MNDYDVIVIGAVRRGSIVQVRSLKGACVSHWSSASSLVASARIGRASRRRRCCAPPKLHVEIVAWDLPPHIIIKAERATVIVTGRDAATLFVQLGDES